MRCMQPTGESALKHSKEKVYQDEPLSGLKAAAQVKLVRISSPIDCRRKQFGSRDRLPPAGGM
jgi:hypothetical protein